ncbi:hypothetical protein BaRGS_00040322 [Batillaria attramentaria]|uniref:Secreted protein n=1 Tax=Batillaria attramentaria TaxID=370345 RepID=A0ABD0J1C9_9CAEN
MERVNGAVRVTHAGVGIVCVSRLRLCCFLRWDLTRTQNKNEINVREGGTRQKKRKERPLTSCLSCASVKCTCTRRLNKHTETRGQRH